MTSVGRYKAKLKSIHDPLEMLNEIRNFPGTLGDFYYKDLEAILWDQVDYVLANMGY